MKQAIILLFIGILVSGNTSSRPQADKPQGGTLAECATGKYSFLYLVKGKSRMWDTVRLCCDTIEVNGSCTIDCVQGSKTLYCVPNRVLTQTISVPSRRVASR